MISAFGVDHGEFSKARYQQNQPKRMTRAQRRTKGKAGVLTGPQKIVQAAHRAGEAPVSVKGIGGSVGRGIQGTGRFLANRPGLTGAALVGGGGAAGYKYLSDKEPKKKS